MSVNEFLAKKVDIKSTYEEYSKILEKVTEYLTNYFSEQILEIFNKDDNSKIKILGEIEKFLNDNSLGCKEYKRSELINKIYSDSFEFSFLNKYIYNTDVEEINCNAWDSIIVNFTGGKSEFLQEKFKNKDHALTILKNILRVSGGIINNVSPIAYGDIGKNKRITAMIPPIIENEIGISFSIRNVNSNKITKETFLNGGTATEEMLNFLSNIMRYKVSVCIAGATGSGKTAILNWLLSTLPDEMRIITIESGSNELDLIKKDSDGNVINNIIHTKTKENKNNKEFEVTQDKLLALALRYHPDLIAVGEMRDKEAYTAQEAANTGHTVVSTTHSSNSIDTYDRILTLSLKANAKVNDEKLLRNIIKGFPIIVYAKQLEDKSRKIMDILETYIDEKGEVKHNTLYTFEIDNVEYKDYKTTISGNHIKKNKFSKNFENRLLENGMPTKLINTLKGDIK